MQTGNREFNGKNQFWTPSNLGLTQSLIDNKLNNIDNSDLLSKTEAEKKYLKISNAIVPKFHSFSLYTTDGYDKKQYITSIGTSVGSIKINIPSTVGNGIKLIYINFSVQCVKLAALKALAFDLDESYNWTGSTIKTAAVKGVCTDISSDSRYASICSFSIHDIYTTKIRTLYLHPFFDDGKSYSDDIYFYIMTGAPQVNVRIIEY